MIGTATFVMLIAATAIVDNAYPLDEIARDPRSWSLKPQLVRPCLLP